MTKIFRFLFAFLLFCHSEPFDVAQGNPSLSSRAKSDVAERPCSDSAGGKFPPLRYASVGMTKIGTQTPPL